MTQTIDNYFLITGDTYRKTRVVSSEKSQQAHGSRAHLLLNPKDWMMSRRALIDGY